VTGPSERLFGHNLAALAAVAPEFRDRMAAFRDGNGRIVSHPGDPNDINLEFDGRLLYPGGAGARRQAQMQVETYLNCPDRLLCGAPPRNGLSEDITDCVRQPIDALIAGRPHAASRDANPGAALIMFGVGLGEQINLLFERLAFRHLALIEPFAELLWHSLWLQDWTSWLERLAARQGSIRLIVGDDPTTTSTELLAYLRGPCFGTLHGSYFFRHYDSIPLDQCRQEVARRLNASFLDSRGFFEDQLLMLANTTRNVAGGPVRLIVNRPGPARDMPAVIIGAGPSLDKNLGDLARLREHAVFFSAGTTLGSLLRQGIVPDFQCEIENTAENYDALAPVAAAHDLAGIRLIGSTTVDARIPRLFGETLFYLRDGMVTAALFGDQDTVVHGTSPNCVTLAIRMAAEFGFREILLFGTDFGSRHPDRHHVADSIWMTDPAWADTYRRVADRLEIAGPANFGGKAYTNRLLHGFLNATEMLIAALPHVRFFNCADGLRIAGAAARLGSQIRPAATNADPRKLAATIAAGYVPAGHIAGTDIGALQAACRRWGEELGARLTALRAAGADLVAWNDAIEASFTEAGQALRFLVEGSVLTMFQYAFHHAVEQAMMDDADFHDTLLAGFKAAFALLADRLDNTVADSPAPAP
jgi:hypothetical protein